MTDSIYLRKAKPNDVQDIAALLVNTWRSCYSDFIDKSFLDNLDIDRQIIRHSIYIQKDVEYIVVEDEYMSIIGFASYGKNRINLANSSVEIYTLYVDFNHQDKGIGDMLLRSIINTIRDRYASISVLVFEQNPFKQFYPRKGFQLIGNEPIELGSQSLNGEVYYLKM